MNSKKGLSRIMSALLAASSMIGGVSARRKKVVKRANSAGVVLDSKKNRGRNERKKADVGVGTVSSSKGISGYSFWKDPRSYVEAILVSSALGFGGAAIYYRQKANLYERFAKELGSFYFRFFGCKSVGELCDCLYAGKSMGGDERELKFWRAGKEMVVGNPVSLNAFNANCDSPFSSILNNFVDTVTDVSTIVSTFGGYVRIGDTWVDIKPGDRLIDIAARFAFYDTFLKSCLSDDLVLDKESAYGLSFLANCEVSSTEDGEPDSVCPLTGDGLLRHAKEFVKGNNDIKGINEKKIEQKFNLCKEFGRELRDRIERLESQAKK